MTDQMPLLADGWGWDPAWPKIGTTAREDLDNGGHSIWVVIHGRRAPRWYCVDSTGPGRVGQTCALGEESSWRTLGRVPGTPVWPVSLAYPRPLPGVAR